MRGLASIKDMKKFLIATLVTWVLIGIAAVVTAKVYLDPYLKQLIEQKGSEAINGKISISSAETHFIPLSLVIKGLDLSQSTQSNAKLKVTVPETEISIHVLKLLKKTAAIQVKLVSPRIEFEKLVTLEASKKTESSNSTDASTGASLFKQLQQKPYLLALNFTILDGVILYKSPEQSIELNDIDIMVDMPSPQSEWIAKAGSDINYGAYKVPVFIQTQLQVEKDLLVFTNTKANISGVDLALSGAVNLETLAAKIELDSKIPQIESLHAPVDTGCAKLKSGSIDLKINAETKESFSSPTAFGKIHLQKVKTTLACDIQSAVLNGSADIDTELQFKYGPALSFDKLKFKSDLSAVEIKYKDLFRKSEKKVFYVDIEASQSDEKVYLKDSTVTLDKFKIKANGLISYAKGSISDIGITLAKTDLKGLEEMFPILASQPVEGEAELSAKIKGDLTSPMDLDVDINPLSLRNIKASFAWQSGQDKLAKKLKGPMGLNISGMLKAHGAELQNAKLLINLDLSKFEIQTPYFIKTAQNILTLNIEAEHKQNKVFIKNGVIQLPGGAVKVTGSLSSPQKPILDFNFKTERTRIEPLIKLMPAMNGYKVIGTADANVTLIGQYDFTGGVEKSPLSMKGQIKLFFDDITTPIKPKTPVPKSGEVANEGTVTSEPILESWPLYKNSNIQISSNIKHIKYDSLLISGVSTNHSFVAGKLLSSGSIQSLFGGKFLLKNSSYNLLEKSPTLDFAGSAQNLQIDQAVTWLSNEWKDLMRGAASGQFQFKIIHSSIKDHLKASKGSGQFEIKNGFLSTLSFDQMANEKISKIPGLSSRTDLKLNSKGAAGDMSASFDLALGKVNFSKFNIITPEKNEMRARGWVDLDKSIDLSADVFLSDPPVKGSVREANSDASGRLVVPIRISGNVFSPQLDITNDTAKVLLEKTAKLEASKLQKKFTVEAQKQGQKLGNDLKNEAEKKLKNLFK